jgi:hypothetical protein
MQFAIIRYYWYGEEHNNGKVKNRNTQVHLYKKFVKSAKKNVSYSI